MGVEMPEVEALRLQIRRREWEESAKRALATKATLNSMCEVVEDATRMGATNTELYKEIKARVEAAQVCGCGCVRVRMPVCTMFAVFANVSRCLG